MEPRSAKASGKDFPYRSDTTCYIEVHKNGTVSHGGGREAYDRAIAGESTLYAVWPGEWRSDLFLIDDLDEYARALGIIHDVERTGLQEHEHQVRWEVSPFEKKPDGSYITIDVRLGCGCEIRDLAVFAKHMREQRGWDIATSGGWGGSKGRHYVRVRRKSLNV
jgi:hypothetical protein